MIGLAIRSAQSLGLHLQDVTRSTSRAEKEIRAQTWFAVSSLESVLTVTTGRPSMVQERHCTVVMPPTYAGEMSSQSGTPSDYSYQTSKDFGTRAKNPSQRSFAERLSDLNTNQNSAIYFRHYTELCVLSKEAVSELYNPHIRDNKWSEIQSLMESFDRRLLQWKDALNPPFNVATSSSDPETESCRVALRIIFHSTRAIVNRPCLCRLNQRMTDQSSSSRQKNRGFAIKCVDSSRAVLNLILNKPDRVVLQQGASWWMLMGHLKRALTVLLLELSFRAEHKPGDASEILDEAKAAVNWLHIRASSDPTARRTWVTMSRLLQLAAPKVGGHTADIDVASEDPIAGSSFQQDLLSSSTPTTTHSNAFTPQWMYGGVVDPNQGLNFGDVAARSELDRFGFLRQHGGVGSLFPTTSESGRRGGKGGADQEMGDEGWRGEWWPRNG